MRRTTVLIAIIISLCFAEKPTIDLNVYKSNKRFSTSEASYTIGTHTFTLVNIRPLGKSDTACISAICIDKRKYVLYDIGVEGGPFGLFVPRQQPLPEGMIVLKASPIDAKTFIFLTNGKLVTLPGVQTFVDTAGKHVYCIWDNDKQYRLTVFDYRSMRLVIPTTVIAQPIQWHVSNMTYYFTAPQEKGYYSVDVFTKSVTKVDQADGTLSPISYLMDFSKIDAANCCNAKALKK